MQIETMTVRDAMDLMGSPASEEAAVLMLGYLRDSEAGDTRDIPDDVWCGFIRDAVASVKGGSR